MTKFLSERFYRRISLVISLGINGLLIYYYHNRFWWPPDEGLLAYLAQRLHAGAVLSKDFLSLHPGYLHFVHAWAFELFGNDLVSLRYPLAFIALLQSMLVFFIFRRSGNAAAVAASVIPMALGVLHYLNPNQHWYCLFLTIVLMTVLLKFDERSAVKILLAGCLVVLIYLMRQLSGVIVGIGTISYLFLEQHDVSAEKSGRLVQSLLLIMAAGLFYYLWKYSDLLGFVFIGIWPVLILVWLSFTMKVTDRKVFYVGKYFFLGGIAAALPLFIYLIYNGALSAWFEDTVMRAFAYSGHTFFRDMSFAVFMSAALKQLSSVKTLSALLNGLYWLTLPFFYIGCGYLTLRTLMEKGQPFRPKDWAPPFLATFYAVITLHYQIPIYLYHSISLSILGLLWMFLKNFSKKVVLGYLTLCLGFSMIGVFYHAGQPLTRGIDGYVAGKRSHFVLAHNRLPYVNLWIEEGDIKLYESIISAIRKEAGEHETIFAIPYNPELYFLADRKNAFSFSFFDQGVINDDDFAKVRKVFQESPPKLVIDSPFDKRQNKSSRLLMRYVKENYQLIGIIGDFRLYRLRTANR